ncbi:hypothetical protein [Pseudoalteromonas sp. S16_S37]|uniref:hypothetical protein n=1 Tax=Pseudoalteromonas sp. S16_S37 TaxID=2720228 RepID=UPI0016804A50|nr:hypothetical protein [Pseudoalteromonas sp. S16_S37]MBD1581068.1 hypothetical protein [Pseudoalteromonas sp. S16_S37]
MRYFEQQLGELSGPKPILYASYSKVADGDGSQGGVLPKQIFMHWDRNDLEKEVEKSEFVEKTIWFFAHEVAHLYQKSSKGQIYAAENQSWLHEGGANWFAANAILVLYPDKKEYVNKKVERYKEHCVKGLADGPLIEAASRGRFDLYYTCGLLIHRGIELAAQRRQKQQENTYTIWKKFRHEVELGAPSELSTFLTVVENETSKELVSTITNMINTRSSEPPSLVNQLFDEM